MGNTVQRIYSEVLTLVDSGISSKCFSEEVEEVLWGQGKDLISSLIFILPLRKLLLGSTRILISKGLKDVQLVMGLELGKVQAQNVVPHVVAQVKFALL